MRAGHGTGFRFTLIKGLFLAVALVLVARLIHIQIFRHEEHRAEAERQWHQARTITPSRGDLFDRYGRPMALTVNSFRVGVAGSLVKDRQELAIVLARALDRDPAVLERTLSRLGDKHKVLAREAFLDAEAQQALLLHAAITLDEQNGRVYPLDGVGASLIGFYSEDPDSTVHRTGLELGLDALLVGQPGRAMRVRSAVPGEDHGDLVVDPVRHGADVVLTLDADLQEICESRLKDAIPDNRASGGSVLIMDPGTGDILAAASWPILDTRNRRIEEAGAWINSNITGMYEPGSVFKIFTAAALLAHGAVDTSTVFDCADTRFEGFTIREAAGHSYGRLTFMQAFEQSSNVWFARAVANLSQEEHYRSLLDFGFGRGTGVLYPAELDGMLAAPDGWSRRSQATIAIGQEVAVTPLQLGLAISAVANGGTLYAPRVHLEVRDKDGELIESVAPRPLRRVLPRGMDQLLRHAMRQVVTDGTGKVVDRPWIAIGGKTGTAQKAVTGRGYKDGLHMATFAGMLPIDNPRLVIVAILDEPKGIKHYAAQSAAPLFGEVVDDIRRTTSWLTDVDNTSQRVIADAAPAGVPVPDVLFLTADSANLRLEQAGFEVEGAQQDGMVVMQVPAGGSRVAPGTRVQLTVQVRVGDEAQVCPDLMGLSNRQVRALAARLGVTIDIAGVGYVVNQTPAPGDPITADGLTVRMANSWK